MTEQHVVVIEGEQFIFNGKDRAYTEVPFGYALYEGSVIDDNWVGWHKGVVGDEAGAKAWLHGSRLRDVILVWPHIMPEGSSADV